jgi:hypothetical protein
VSSTPGVRATRIGRSPIVRPEMDARMGNNVNGPSLVRAPEWLAGRLGTYYLYFAHHKGTYIRLAVADDLNGPWRIHTPGVLDLEASFFTDHIASPDVHVDEGRRELRMYFHGLVRRRGPVQGTRLATSADGLTFKAHRRLVAPRPYLRAFRWAGAVYGLTMSGVFWRSPDGVRPFEHMPWPGGKLPTLRQGMNLDRSGQWPGPLPFRSRHAAVHVVGDVLLVVYSMAGESPERLVYSWVRMAGPWSRWRGSGPQDLLAPEEEWEGGDLPIRESMFGAAYERVRELRDPAIFEDDDGRLYLVYSIAGESGLAMARLEIR